MLTFRQQSVLRLFTLVLALVAGLAIALSAMLSAAQAAPVGKLTQFKVPTGGSSPDHITEASDGNFWFTESFINNQNASGHNLGRITPTGEVTEFQVCDFCFPNDIVQGSDGFLYFTSNDGLGRISTNGDSVSFINAPFSVGGNALDAHANDIWITDFNRRSLWRYDILTGEFTDFPLSDTNTISPHDIAVAGNGAVWFGASDLSDQGEQGLIGRLDPAAPTTTETVTTFQVDAVPRAINISTDNKVWFTARFTPQALGYFDPATSTAAVFPTDGGPQDIAPAPDGAMWFTRTTAGNIARINADGVITAELKAVKGSEPFGITVASNGDPWFTMLSADKIATFQLR